VSVLTTFLIGADLVTSVLTGVLSGVETVLSVLTTALTAVETVFFVATMARSTADFVTFVATPVRKTVDFVVGVSVNVLVVTCMSEATPAVPEFDSQMIGCTPNTVSLSHRSTYSKSLAPNVILPIDVAANE
jgi:hypothetical protein